MDERQMMGSERTRGATRRGPRRGGAAAVGPRAFVGLGALVGAPAVLGAFLLFAGCDSRGDAARAEEGAGLGEAGRNAARPDTTLERLLDEILPRVERASGMEARARPRLARSDTGRLKAYLVARFEEQLPAERASTLTAVYSRFGLVPDTLDLRGTLLALYEEQVVGYYDPRSDTLFVLEHVPAEQLEMVLAHELVHALQDQHVSLDSLIETVEGENDRGTAAQAAVEGHATLAMLEWQLGRMGGVEVDVTALPDLAERLDAVSPEALGEAAGLPALGRAPRIIREALLFPYIGGLGFVQRVWKARPGRPAPFGGDLPASTEQVMHPERFLAEPRDGPARVRFVSGPPTGWEEVYADGLGELETRIFLEEHLGAAAADSIARRRAAAGAEGWDGDRYRLLRTPSGELLVWVSVWDSEAEADEFAAVAREAWARRYGMDAPAEAGPISSGGRAVEVRRGSVSGRSAVVVTDRPVALSRDEVEAATDARAEGG